MSFSLVAIVTITLSILLFRQSLLLAKSKKLDWLEDEEFWMFAGFAIIPVAGLIVHIILFSVIWCNGKEFHLRKHVYKLLCIKEDEE